MAQAFVYTIISEYLTGSTPWCSCWRLCDVLLDFALNLKAATLIFISGRGSAILSAKEGESGFIYNLVKS